MLAGLLHAGMQTAHLPHPTAARVPELRFSERCLEEPQPGMRAQACAVRCTSASLPGVLIAAMVAGMMPNTDDRTKNAAGIFDNTFHDREARRRCMRRRLLAWLQVFA